MDLAACLVSRDVYRRLLERLYGYILVWEDRVASLIEDPAFFDERRKLRLLRQDLLFLGLGPREVAALPLCGCPPVLSDRAEAFGSMYVMEGSTLGGTLIAREVGRRLGLGADTGCAYFRSYGPAIGAMWQAFRQRLDGSIAPGRHDAVIGAANRSFDALRIWLEGAGTPELHGLPVAS